VGDYACIKKDKSEFVKILNEEVSWEGGSDNFVSSVRWKETEDTFMEFLHFMESAHGNVLSKDIRFEDCRDDPAKKRRYVFESLNRTWQQEIEMIGNSVMGTTKLSCDEILSILTQTTKKARELRIALAMELLYD